MKTKQLPLLIGYCVPWIFGILYIDHAFGWIWQYGVSILCMVGLGWLCCRAGTPSAAVWGNVLSVVSSAVCVYLFRFGELSSYFKPFGALGWVMALTCLSWLLQWLVCKKQWLIAGLLTGCIGAFVLFLYWIQFSM